MVVKRKFFYEHFGFDILYGSNAYNIPILVKKISNWDRTDQN